MKSTTTVALGEVKNRDCLALLRTATQKVKARTQTLAALRRLADRDTGHMFASIKTIAQIACLPERGVKRHLKYLVCFLWIKRRGRVKQRRTVSYMLPQHLLNRDSAQKYSLLPRWSARMLPSWGERVIFSLIVSRDKLCERVNEERYEYSIKALSRDSGLGRHAVIEAKQKLLERRIITIYCGDAMSADELTLNLRFPVPKKYIDGSVVGE